MSKPRVESFFDRHLGTVVMVGVLIVGQITGYALLQARVNSLEDNNKDTVHRSEHAELERRTAILEQELVPRSEHMLRDTELNKRLDEIQSNVKEIRDRVEIIDNRGRGR